MNHEALNEALPGGNMGSDIKNMSEQYVCHGNITDDSMEAAGFTAEVVMMHHLGQIAADYAPVLACQPAHISCKFADRKKDRSSFW